MHNRIKLIFNNIYRTKVTIGVNAALKECKTYSLAKIQAGHRARAISAQYNVVHWYIPVRVVLLLSPEGSLGKRNTSLISSQVRPSIVTQGISWHTVEPVPDSPNVLD